MKKYHIFESLFLSFYSKPLYQNVAREWKGLGLLYLLLVLAICWLPFSYDFHRFIIQLSSQILPGVIEQMPAMTLSKGKLSIDKPVPYSIKEPGDGATLVIFDTSGKYTSLDNLNAYMLITQDKMIIRKASDPKSTTTYSLSKLQDGTFTRAQFADLANRVIFLSSVLMYPISVLISFIYRFLEALLLGGLGLLFANLYRVQITYKTSIRLAVVALTPVLFLMTLIEYFSWPISYIGWLVALLTVGYLGYAVHAQRSQD